jgi:hypothetical protein
LPLTVPPFDTKDAAVLPLGLMTHTPPPKEYLYDEE